MENKDAADEVLAQNQFEKLDSYGQIPQHPVTSILLYINPSTIPPETEKNILSVLSSVLCGVRDH